MEEYKLKTAAVYIGSSDELNFFSRMQEGLLKRGFRLLIISNKISVLLAAKVKGLGIMLVKKSKPVENIPDLSRCYDFKSGQTSYAKAEILYSSVYVTFSNCCKKKLINILFIWNGHSVQTMAASSFARSYNIKTLFFELANIPGKIFSDPCGVNAFSSIYKNPELLDGYDITDAEYKNWKNQFLNKAKLSIHIPQQKQVKKIKNYFFLIDLISFYLFNIPENGETRIYKKLKQYFTPALHINYDNYNFIKGNYIFLPLQVSLDTQLLFNSELNNIDAVKYASDMAAEKKLDLVVKLHPAENNIEFIEELLSLKLQLKFFLINAPVVDLIQNASLVVTINSTAGLEALILNKQVIFLGHSFYPLLNGRLKKYLLGYLLDGDYFSDVPVPQSSIDEFLKRAA